MLTSMHLAQPSGGLYSSLLNMLYLVAVHNWHIQIQENYVIYLLRRGTDASESVDVILLVIALVDRVKCLLPVKCCIYNYLIIARVHKLLHHKQVV